jgi:membrane fusion protein (multidrug efflux system)
MAEKAKKIRLFVFILLAVALTGGGLRWWTHGRFIESTDNAYVRADITAITPRVVGEIMSVQVKNNQPVKKGDLLLQIDARDYEARLANAKATVAVREASLVANVQQKATQRAMIEEARATLDAAKADASRAQKDFQRADTLVKQGVATNQRLDTATASNKAAQATVTRTNAGVQVANQQSATLDADRARLQAELEAAQASLKLAELDLAATELRAPVDGVVGDLSARVGERVNAGIRLLSIVPLDAVFVEANFKETQLTKIVPGQEVLIEADTFPGHPLKGHINSLAPASGAEFALLPPQNASGNFNKIVQRVPVKVTLDNLGDLRGLLRPGMSVTAEVDTRTTPSAATVSAQ